MKKAKYFGAVMLLCALLASAAQAQAPHGIPLNPGERLIAINGVPVEAYQQRPPARAVARVVGAPVRAAGHAVGAALHGSDQRRCEQEAAYMAAHGIRGHVGGTIGRFEGCGWSSSGTPGTCTPSYQMRLTGDATVCNGTGCYRVRSWR